LAPFFSNQSTLGAIFACIFREFAQIFRDFAKVFTDFQRLFPDFHQIKTFGGALETPAPPPPTPLKPVIALCGSGTGTQPIPSCRTAQQVRALALRNADASVAAAVHRPTLLTGVVVFVRWCFVEKAEARIEIRKVAHALATQEKRLLLVGS